MTRIDETEVAGQIVALLKQHEVPAAVGCHAMFSVVANKVMSWRKSRDQEEFERVYLRLWQAIVPELPADVAQEVSRQLIGVAQKQLMENILRGLGGNRN
jgi:hypothetical protein